jgi:receptor expression-enhancing protein 1/2/3/4
MLTFGRFFRSVSAFIFPIFACYKALKANDQAQLTQWLMYWVVVGSVLAVENLIGWLLNWYPHLVR